MKITNLVCFCGLVALSLVVKAQDEADSIALKEYFNSQEGLAIEERGEKLRDFVITPDNPKFSEIADYSLEFSVSTKTFYKIVNGYLVFYFPEGFGLSELTTAGINTDFGFIQLIITKVETESRFVILNYFREVSDTLWDSTMVPERVNFDIKLHQIVNPSRTRSYKISGAAITDHRFVAGPTWSESFEITEESQETKAELQIVSTEMVAPNSLKVNTNQEFSIEVLVANVGNKTAHNVSVGLVSDGASTINSPKTIETIEPNDTALVSLEVTAAAESGTENFSSDIISGNVIEVEALDDTAGAVIQTPAVLVLSSSVKNGDTIYVEPNVLDTIKLLVTNLGEASVGLGQYNFDSSHSGPYHFRVGTEFIIIFSNPSVGSEKTHILEITEVPIDSNTMQTAPINLAVVEFTMVAQFDEDQDFENSLIVENNPFNPNDGPVRFVYNLQGASDVELNIFSVTGEEVYSHTYLSGSEGGKTGSNQIQWDGRNSEGEMVLNGVYVTMLNVLSTGEKASLKLAVLK